MKSLLAAAVSLSLIAGSITPVYAHDRDDRNDHDRREWRGNDSHHDRHDSRRDDRRDGRNDRDHDRFDDARHYRSGYDAGRYVAPRGYAVRSWHRGEYLPRAYYSTRYVVNDYDAYRLYAPPRGHHWVRVDHDVLLTAVATGAVVAVVSNLFH